MDKQEMEKVNEAVATQKVSRAIIPKTISEGMEIARILCKSGIVPKDMTGRPEAVYMAVAFGLEVGLSPSQAVTSIMVVNGRPSIWGDAVKALVLGSGLCEQFTEDNPSQCLKQGFGRCVVKRKGMLPTEMTFTVDEAKKAGLWGKPGPWQNYPGRMLQMRARSWACRDTFPDVLKGLSVAEEVVDIQSMPSATVYEPTPEPHSATITSKIVDAEIPEDCDIPCDAQAPGDDGEALLDVETRKQLFKNIKARKISMEDLKTFLSQTFGVTKTSDLKFNHLEKIDDWMGKVGS